MDNIYSNTTASTLVSEPNSSYLGNIHSKPLVMPLSDPTMGLMMLLSTFQYQAPYMNGTYSNAASQAGKAAFVMSGGQDAQNKLADKSKDFVYSLGLTNAEMGLLLGSAKTIRDRQLTINGPRIYSVKTNLTASQTGGSIGLGWTFK